MSRCLWLLLVIYDLVIGTPFLLTQHSLRLFLIDSPTRDESLNLWVSPIAIVIVYSRKGRESCWTEAKPGGLIDNSCWKRRSERGYHMANSKHLDILKQGIKEWNQWRQKHPDVRPDLSEAQLGDANLRNANLRGANLSGAQLSETQLSKANLSGADLSRAYLFRADLD